MKLNSQGFPIGIAVGTVVLASIAVLYFFGVLTFAMGAKQSGIKTAAGTIATSIFDFEVQNGKGELIALSQYRGKGAYLVVNAASK